MNDESKMKVWNWQILRNHEFPPRKMLLSPWMPERSLTMIYASPGIGKTWLAMSVAGAVASGGELFGWKADQKNHVVYIDGEMPVSEILSRGNHLWSEDADINLMMSDVMDGQMPDLALPEAQVTVTHSIKAPDGRMPSLLVLDNISSLVRTGNENEAESWAAIQNWLLSLKRQGTSVLLVHHASRAGNARGTSKREDLLDAIIHLKKPNGSHSGDGCRFDLSFTKTRNVLGVNGRPFEAKLLVDEHDKLIWTKVATGEERKKKVIELHGEGLSVREIAKEVGVGKSTVQKIIKENTKDDADGE